MTAHSRSGSRGGRFTEHDSPEMSIAESYVEVAKPATFSVVIKPHVLDMMSDLENAEYTRSPEDRLVSAGGCTSASGSTDAQESQVVSREMPQGLAMPHALQEGFDSIAHKYLQASCAAPVTETSADLYSKLAKDIIPKGKDAFEGIMGWFFSRVDLSSQPGAALAVIQSYAAVMIAREQRCTRMHADLCHFVSQKMNADVLLQSVREKAKAEVVTTYLKEKFAAQKDFVHKWADLMRDQQKEMTRRIEQMEITKRHKIDAENAIMVVKKYWPKSLHPYLVAKVVLLMVVCRRLLGRFPLLRSVASPLIMLLSLAQLSPALRAKLEVWSVAIVNKVGANVRNQREAVARKAEAQEILDN